ncbi:hypothetical protein [Phreatobacter sp.]|uniref:hypothetical protein n=1 Tax=Phreatobacter sp. TaxID=1966341 RepID=UPI003F730202
MHYRPFGIAPASRPAAEPMGLGLLAGLSALFGGLFYMADVTLPDLLRHPLWSLRQLTIGSIGELVRAIPFLLQGALIAAPVWLLLRRRGR